MTLKNGNKTEYEMVCPTDLLRKVRDNSNVDKWLHENLRDNAKLRSASNARAAHRRHTNIDLTTRKNICYFRVFFARECFVAKTKIYTKDLLWSDWKPRKVRYTYNLSETTPILR